ncbi:hypothetical protein [Sphingomonas baiyangensis]|uniref:NIPSNAP protein n=1 Tax=Sphingomonas baiyangensis TaxID=2572576 RepID=A0A4U1L8A5_9SPHN|nr:hypothetical protein [Sphingomonas baiyangensis]TKD53192.1 hypothetical protein FBR43_02360 [Sphingomonas baiyangensis]
MTATKQTNVRYAMVNMTKFKPGAARRANETISKTFMPSAKAAGIPMPSTYHPQTGEWDVIAIFPMADGISELEYSMTPSDAKWLAAMSKSLGGQDKAMALIDEYNGLIETNDRMLVHEHTD